MLLQATTLFATFLLLLPSTSLAYDDSYGSYGSHDKQAECGESTPKFPTGRYSCTIVVTSLSDGTLPELAGDRRVSLREAIEAANTGSSVDGSKACGSKPATIVFSSRLSGTITLDPDAGRFDLTATMRIHGPYSYYHSWTNRVTLDAQGNSRIFWIDDGDNDVVQSVEIAHLNLTGGDTTNDASSSNGGAIFTKENLALRYVDVSGNFAESSGGGAYFDNDARTEDLTTWALVEHSVFEYNTAEGFEGGAMKADMDAQAERSATIFTVKDSVLRHNTADGGGAGGGGAIDSDNDVNSGHENSTLIVHYCNNDMSYNTVTQGHGGAFAMDEDGLADDSKIFVKIHGNRLAYNHSGDRGGAIYFDIDLLDPRASLELDFRENEVIGNTSDGAGAGVYDFSNSVDEATRMTVTVEDSTFAYNKAMGHGGGYYIANRADSGSTSSRTFSRTTFHHNWTALDGAGIYLDGSSVGEEGPIEVSVLNSTFSGNRANGNGGGLRIAEDGAPFPGTLLIAHTTVTENEADADGAGGETGGGIHSDSSYDPDLANTIVAQNRVDGSQAGPGTDLVGDFVGEFNLIGNGDGSTGLVDGVDENQVGTSGDVIDAKLVPLADNGGETKTHALWKYSPALDQGNNAGPYRTYTDQRGRRRTVDERGIYNAGDGTDIGAYERGGYGW